MKDQFSKDHFLHLRRESLKPGSPNVKECSKSTSVEHVAKEIETPMLFVAMVKLSVIS